MKAKLLHPQTPFDGGCLETLAIFAARRCRTTKSHDDLLAEVTGYSTEKRRNFLKAVVFEDWAADILEMITLTYDLEDIPIWLIIELLRHRLLAREFSLEQLSQRAIDPGRLRVEIDPDYPGLQELVNSYIRSIINYQDANKIPFEVLREAFPQGVLVNLVISGNLRAFMHFFFMRSSPLHQGKGGAHPKFMELADSMQMQAKAVLPITMESILQA